MGAISVNTFGGIIDTIKEIFSVIGNFQYVLVNVLKSVFNVVMSLVYYVFRGLSFITSFCELLFNKMAGISPVYDGVNPVDNILLGYLFSDAVISVFMSMIVLSVFLLIVFTFIAVVKSEFTLDIKNSAKAPIFARAFKGIAMFFVTPVVTILGILLTTGLTKTLAQMFNGGSAGIANQIFYVAAYDANRVRSDETFARLFAQGWNNDGGNFQTAGDIDDAFKTTKVVVKTTSKGQYSFLITSQKSQTFTAEQGNFFLHVPYGYRLLGADTQTLLLQYPDNGAFSELDTLYYSIDNVIMVNYYYDLLKFDYLIGIGGILVVSWCLLTTCLALIKRIFDIVLLWLISPAMIAQYPLDDGKAAKSCNKEMISRVISVLASVFAFNMFFIIVPVFTSLTIFPMAEVTAVSSGVTSSVVSAVGATDWLTILAQAGLATSASYVIAINGFMQIIGICVGASIIKQASALVSKMLGVEDLIKSGKESAKKVAETAAKAVEIGGALATGGVAAVARLGIGKLGKQLRGKMEDKAAREASAEYDRVLAEGGNEKDAKKAYDKKFADSMKKSKQAMTKSAVSNFSNAFGLGGVAKKYYDAKSAIKDLKKPDKEYEDLRKTEMMKKQIIAELGNGPNSAKSYKKTIEKRKADMIKRKNEAREDQEREEAKARQQKENELRARKQQAVREGRIRMSAEHQAQLFTGGKIHTGVITKHGITQGLSDAKDAVGDALDSAWTAMNKWGNSVKAKVKNAHPIKSIKNTYHKKRQTANKLKAIELQAEIDKLNDAIDKGEYRRSDQQIKELKKELRKKRVEYNKKAKEHKDSIKK